VKLLLDTHLLLWAAAGGGGPSGALPPAAERLLVDPENQLCFSAASLWEVSIKASLGRNDFKVDPDLLRRGLLDNGYIELPVTSAHAAAVSHLPPIHQDPFDRMLVAQATAEGVVLLTSDKVLASYLGPIQLV
jgi:PIN domain nuclease of toxin-antitoxin system